MTSRLTVGDPLHERILRMLLAHEEAGTLSVNGWPAVVVSCTPYVRLAAGGRVSEFSWSEALEGAKEMRGRFEDSRVLSRWPKKGEIR